MTKVLIDILISFSVIPCTSMNFKEHFASVDLMDLRIISKYGRNKNVRVT